MYDMYPWDEGSAASGTETTSTDMASANTASANTASANAVAADPVGPESAATGSAGPGTARSGALARVPRPRPEPGISAVQVALDRRDNGGDPAAAPGTSPSSPARQ